MNLYQLDHLEEIPPQTTDGKKMDTRTKLLQCFEQVPPDRSAASLDPHIKKCTVLKDALIL